MSPTRKWFNWLAALFLIGFLGSLAMPRMYIGFEPVSDNGIALHEVRLICRAIKKYYRESGKTRSDQPTIICALIGENPKQIGIIHLRRVDEQGRAFDPWGSPYRFDLSDPKNPKVWSPGKNKMDELSDPHSDDICSWR